MEISPTALCAVFNGLCLLQFTLGAAMIAWWSPCLGRVLRGSEETSDTSRVVWLAFALSSVLLGMHVIDPSMSADVRTRLSLVGHLCMILTMVSAIYIKGMNVKGFRLGRVVSVHLALLVGCIAVAAYAA